MVDDRCNGSGEPRRLLSDILDSGGDSLRNAWETTKPASDFAALQAGSYIARIVNGELTRSAKGYPGYKLTFRVLEGPHAGRLFWHDVWLTDLAMPMAKRDLGKLGITSLEMLEKPLPRGIRCKAKLSLRKGDDGAEHNRVKMFEVVGIDKIDDDDFPPKGPEDTTPLPASLTIIAAEEKPATSKSGVTLFPKAEPQTRSPQQEGR